MGCSGRSTDRLRCVGGDDIRLRCMNVRDTIVTTALEGLSDMPAKDTINPDHYRQHPSGVECCDIADGFNDYCIGNVIKYIWRGGLKVASGKSGAESKLQDYKKAQWYLNRRIAQLEIELAESDGKDN